jgi:hypothetical protein
MSTLIGFLEKLGQDAALRAASGSDLESVLRGAGIEDEARTAILMEDWRKLESLLGAQQHICCAIHRPDDDDDDEEEKPEKADQQCTASG